MKKILKSYFFWTYSRGCFHYDVLVTLVILFIFITPHLWNYGDKPTVIAGPAEPMEVVGDGDHGLVITVYADEVRDREVVLGAGADPSRLKKALKKAVEPVTGDAVYLARWQPINDAAGNLIRWQVWVHR